jgi:hypothetical protein
MIIEGAGVEIKTSILFHRCHRHRGHSLLAANCPQAFIRCRLNTDPRTVESQSSGDVLAHRGKVGRNFWGFRNQGRVHIKSMGVVLSEEGVHAPQDFETADTAQRFVRVGKVMADIAFSDRAQERIGDGVAKHIGVGMTVKTARVRDFDSAQD